MPSSSPDPRTAVVVTGIGVATALGVGKAALSQGLLATPNLFAPMQRPGRILPIPSELWLGAELPGSPDPPPRPERLSARLARGAGLATQVAVAVLDEAWSEAALDRVDPAKIGLVVGGSNLQRREQFLLQKSYADRIHYLPPGYGSSFFDTDLSAVLCSLFPIRGFAYTVGGASASGLIAVLHALEAVRSGRVEVCIALGATQDLSCMEVQALRSLGAMGSDRYIDDPGRSCRPFDRDREGFLFGEMSAGLVIRRQVDAPSPNYGTLLGGASLSDGTRGPDPSIEGEVRVMQAALADAGLTAEQIDYVNAHGTGTPRGDDAEVAAFRAMGLARARINATKSILGHGLSAAGAVEVAAVLLQWRDGRLHPTRNLDHPIADDLSWVQAGGESAQGARFALKTSFGFGGIGAALVLAAPDSVRGAL